MTATPQTAESFQLWQITPDMMASVPAHVGQWIIDVAERSKGEWSAEGIVRKFADGAWQFFVVWDVASQNIVAALATELYRTMTGMVVCQVHFCTGEGAKQWVGLIDELEAFAQANGATRVNMVARPAWAKHLTRYRKTHIILERDI